MKTMETVLANDNGQYEDDKEMEVSGEPVEVEMMVTSRKQKAAECRVLILPRET